jgi:hypothetical protein
MFNRLVLQGVCVSISEPAPFGNKGTLLSTMVLDVVANDGKSVDSIPLDLWADKATAAYRDIMSGDIVTAEATLWMWGPKGKRQVRYSCDSARVLRSVNYGVLIGRVQVMQAPEEYEAGKRRDGWHLRVVVMVTGFRGHPMWFVLHAYGKLSQLIYKRLRIGSLACFVYRVRSKKRTSQPGMSHELLILSAYPIEEDRGPYATEAMAQAEAEGLFGDGDG